MALSAVLIVLNEEKNIEACLKTLSFADEIVVVDSGSSDRTYELAKAFTEKVYQRKFDDFSSQKNFGAGKANSEWVFSIDADERVSIQLAEEIKRTVSNDSNTAAYTVKRKTKLFGKTLNYSGLQADRPVRLFKKGRAHFEQPVHERLQVNGKTGALKETLEHASFQTLSEYLNRLQFYTSLETAGGASTGFFARPLYRFFSLYLFRQGFRDGLEGFIYCALSGYYEFIRRAKLWEKTAGKIHE